jgi:hypothetical protein
MRLPRFFISLGMMCGGFGVWWVAKENSLEAGSKLCRKKGWWVLFWGGSRD